MNIVIVGYGKMGRLIKSVAEQKNHTVTASVDVAAADATVRVAPGDAEAVARAVKSAKADGIVEFSSPSAVVANIKALLPLGIPLVVGTTGWDDALPEITALAKNCGGVLLHASNFSIGVNMFYKIVEEAARLMSPFSEYDVAVWEMHHNQKADSPSGTALEIARRIMKNNAAKKNVATETLHEKAKPEQLHVTSTRCGANPGEHHVFFDSAADTITLTHRARNREGLANGAIFALERLVEGVKTGEFKRGSVYTMEDVL